MLYDSVNQRGDLDRTGDKNLVDDLDLETSVIISIHTERRVEEGDEHSDNTFYKGGCWMDSTDDFGGLMGSRMWLLRREKATQSTINQAKIYLEECLKWMLDDNVAKSVEVTTARGAKPVDLAYTIKIEKPDGGIWFRSWGTQLNEF